MLTSDQKDKLEPLTKHEKFGKLLIEAMKTWKAVNPRQRTFYDDNKNCCLIGASVMRQYYSDADFTSFINPISKVTEFFNLDSRIVWQISNGFDLHCLPDSSVKTEAYAFGEKVVNIIFES